MHWLVVILQGDEVMSNSGRAKVLPVHVVEAVSSTWTEQWGSDSVA